MKILIVTQWFDPEPTFKGLGFAKELQAQGHEVEVITGFPNYPSGKVYAGYKIKFLEKENIDGIRINRVALYANHDQSALRRIANYVSFATSSCLYGLFGSRKADIIYAYHPPLTTCISAALIGFFRRTPVVYDIQDMWPDTLRATGMIRNKKILSFIGKVCDWTYKRATGIVVLSPGFKKLLIERGVPEDKIRIIYNWCEETTLDKPTATEHNFGMQDRFNIVFAGNMGKAQALDSVLNAADIVSKINSKIQFVFVGGGVEVENLKNQTTTMRLDNVNFIPMVPMHEVGHILHSANALLVHLKDDPLFSITIPSKTQAYLSVGKPLLMAVHGDAANLVAQAGAGIIIPPQNPEALARATVELASMSDDKIKIMGTAGREFYQQELSINIGTAKFIAFFNELLNKRNKHVEKTI